MKTVLLVDDEINFLKSLTDGLRPHGNFFRVLTAANGEEALSLLGRETVHLVVTDIKMPKMDGVELMTRLTQSYPKVPVLVMTAFATPTLEKKVSALGCSKFLEKPIDLEDLSEKIYEELEAGTDGILRGGISLTTFIQLLFMERRTNTLRVRSGNSIGYLYFVSGELYDAETGSLTGEAAAYEIIGWPEPEIEISGKCNKKKNRINQRVDQVLLTALKFADEKTSPEAPGKSGCEGEPPTPVDSTEDDDESLLAGDVVATLRAHIQHSPLCELALCTGIIDGTGTLAVLVPDAAEKEALATRPIAALASEAETMSAAMSCGAARIVEFQAERGHLISARLGSKSPLGPDYYLFAFLSSMSELAMAKRSFSQLLGSIAAILFEAAS